jgi:hypothetical protein
MGEWKYSPTILNLRTSRWVVCLTPLCFYHGGKRLSYSLYRGSRDSAVGIATGYGLYDQGIGVRVPVGARIYISSTPILVSTQPPIQSVLGAFSSGVKRPGREARRRMYLHKIPWQWQKIIFLSIVFGPALGLGVKWPGHRAVWYWWSNVTDKKTGIEKVFDHSLPAKFIFLLTNYFYF